MPEFPGTRPIIGIVGGMGPQAGFDLAGRVTSQTPVASDQDHFSLIVLSFPSSVADRTAYLHGDAAENPAGAILAQLERLDELGACVAAIACNTAHAPPILDPILDGLRHRTPRLQLMHLIEETVSAVAADRPVNGRVGILGTPATFSLRLYEDALRGAGLDPVLPEPDIRARHVFPAIYDPQTGIKVRSEPVSAEAREHVRQALVHLADKGAECVILGCTELPLAAPDAADSPVPMVDPADVMARRLIAVARAA